MVGQIHCIQSKTQQKGIAEESCSTHSGQEAERGKGIAEMMTLPGNARSDPFPVVMPLPTVTTYSVHPNSNGLTRLQLLQSNHFICTLLYQHRSFWGILHIQAIIILMPPTQLKGLPGPTLLHASAAHYKQFRSGQKHSAIDMLAMSIQMLCLHSYYATEAGSLLRLIRCTQLTFISDKLIL